MLTVALIPPPTEVAEISNLIDEFWLKCVMYIEFLSNDMIVHQGKLVLSSMLSSAAAGRRRLAYKINSSGWARGQANEGGPAVKVVVREIPPTLQAEYTLTNGEPTRYLLVFT